MSDRQVGSVRRRGNRWQARVGVGYRVDGSARRVARSFDTEQEAWDWVRATAVELRGDSLSGAGITLRQLWEVYQRNRLPELAASTRKGYRQRMTAVVDCMGEVDASQLTHAQIQRMLDGMCPSTAQKTAVALSAVLTYAVRHGLLTTNVMYKAPFSFGSKSDVPESDSEMWDDDPFAAIEERRDVWSMRDAMRCAEAMEGLALEPIFLACVGAGLRVEEAFALRPIDVRRVVGSYDEWGHELWVTQLAVHHATTRDERRKVTKTAKSVGIVPMLEPFGERLYELSQGLTDPRAPICHLSAARQNKTWRSYFAEPPEEWHSRMADSRKATGALYDLHLPYIPLSRMRATHTTYVQQQGLADTMNAAWHRNTTAVQQRHYMSPDLTDAAAQLGRRLV